MLTRARIHACASNLGTYALLRNRNAGAPYAKRASGGTSGGTYDYGMLPEASSGGSPNVPDRMVVLGWTCNGKTVAECGAYCDLRPNCIGCIQMSHDASCVWPVWQSHWRGGRRAAAWLGAGLPGQRRARLN